MISRLIAVLVLGLVVLVSVTSCGTIESGHMGVRTTLGKVNAEEVGPGLYLGLPGISRVQEFSAKETGLDLNDLRVKYAAQHQQAEGSRVLYPAHQLMQRVVMRSLTTDPAIEKAIQENVAAQKQLETTKQRIQIAEAEGIARANQIINQSLTREYLQHEANLALMKFAEKGGTTTVVIPTSIQSAPLIHPGGK